MIDWQRIWNEDDAVRRFSPIRAILLLFSGIYRLIVSARNRLYDRQILKTVRLSRPVISVGNIAVGGTGKTPCVIWLAGMLKRRNFHPAVISRGYGGHSKHPVNVVSDGQSILLDAGVSGDEPLMIARSLPDIPVVTGSRRELTGQAAIEQWGADVLICDDAFQHRRVHRDINIVLLDGGRPLGNGHLLPRGELRESSEGLKRADCLVLTRMDEAQPVDKRIADMARRYNIPVFRAVHRFSEMIQPDGGILPLPDAISGKKICAFCGIARPDSFSGLLSDAGAEILFLNAFPDHYVFSPFDLEELKQKFINLRADYLVTTEKDAMRLAAYPDFLKMVSVLRIQMEISPREAFENFILERVAAFTPQRGT